MALGLCLLVTTLKLQASCKVGEMMCCWAWKGADQQEQLLTSVGSRSLMGPELCTTKRHKLVLCLQWCCYRGRPGLWKALALRSSHLCLLSPWEIVTQGGSSLVLSRQQTRAPCQHTPIPSFKWSLLVQNKSGWISSCTSLPKRQKR